MPLPATWFSRELPVLEATVRLLDHQVTPVPAAAIAEEAGLPLDDTVRALVGMEGEFLTAGWKNRSAGAGRVRAVTPAARRAVGQWPTAETLVTRVLETLDARVEQASTPEERSRWIKARDAVGSAGRDLLVDVMGSVISRQVSGQ